MDQIALIRKYEKALGRVMKHVRQAGATPLDPKTLSDYITADNEINNELRLTKEYAEAVDRADRFAHGPDEK